ncbi:MAG TPA: lysophospholipid acyltransferase family protein [Gemmatimonadaceae bacterium]
MIYRALRWITGIALHWFYRDIRVVGRERIPTHGPLLIAVNHWNALVDSLLVGWVMPRRITMTAKATLVDNPLVAVLFRILGVVPLRRVSDESRKKDGLPFDRARNTVAFREILDLLKNDGAVLIFPEGKSHNATALEPLKTGLARLALQARDNRAISGVRILPIGVVFDSKATPGSLVDIRIGEAIEMESWPNSDAGTLTLEVAARLRALSECGVIRSEESPVRLPSRSLKRLLITMAAWWGRLTHQPSIQVARSLALRQSRDADQPAMLTIMFATGIVLLAYVLQIVVVGVLVRSFWVSVIYLVSLLGGAYWAAFENQPRRS